MNSNDRDGAMLGLMGIIIWLTCIAAWITHIVYCLQHDRWGFLIAGALAFPVAIIHGLVIWFSA